MSAPTFEDGIAFGDAIIRWAEAVRVMDARMWLHDHGQFAELADVPVCVCGKVKLLPPGGSCCYLTQMRARQALRDRRRTTSAPRGSDGDR